MGNNKLMSEIKAILPDLVDSNRNFRTMPIGKTGKAKLAKDRIELLEEFVKILRDTDIICKETKEYLFDRYITISGVTEKLNFEEGNGDKQYINNTVTSKIAYDRAKLSRLFGEDFLAEIVGKRGNKQKLEEYRKQLGLAYIKYGSKDGIDIRDQVILPLNKKMLSTNLDDDKFNQFIGIILPYFKSQIKAIADSIDEDCIGYFNFISTSPMLSDKDKERLQRIRILMGLEESHIVSDIDNVNIE